MSERVLVSFEGGVADVRLNRPDKLNALDAPMFEALAAAGRTLASRRDLRAVVLSGEGRAFCAGLDMASFAAMAGRRASQDCASGVRAKPGNVAARFTSRHFGWWSAA